MDNPFDEMKRAVQQARETKLAVEQQANSMAALLAGNLRGVDSWYLKKLKQELRGYNMHTGRWTNRK